MHRLILVVAPLALVACSSCSPQANAASPHAQSAQGAQPQSADDTHTKPAPGTLKTFGDWAVGCDNTLSCTMASLGPESGDFPAINVLVERTAGPAGIMTITLVPNDGLAPDTKPRSIAIDGHALRGPFGDGDTPALSGETARVIVAAMVNGHQLAIRDAAGKQLASLSLNGASAGLRYIDAQQHRAGSVTAIVAKGERPLASVPNAPLAPTIAALTASGQPTKLGASAIAALRTQASCDDSAAGETETHALGGGATLILLPCSAGAYNMSAAVFVATGSKTAPARIDAPSGFTEDESPAAIPSVVNGDFTDGVLTSYAKGRGLGDCGTLQEFVWDGTMFRLSSQSEMGECRGDPNYITTWSTRVTHH